jgi:hypothetical protein
VHPYDAVNFALEISSENLFRIDETYIVYILKDWKRPVLHQVSQVFYMRIYLSIFSTEWNRSLFFLVKGRSALAIFSRPLLVFSANIDSLKLHKVFAELS